MPVIGITGGISTGKTSFCDCLREIVPAAKFFDADTAARELTDRDAEVKRLLRERFGAGNFFCERRLESGRTSRDSVRRRGKETRARANPASAHPPAVEPSRRKSRATPAELFLADIPLLYETDGETLCDRVVVVACSREHAAATLDGARPHSNARPQNK